MIKSIIVLFTTAVLFCSCADVNKQTAENTEQTQENETNLQENNGLLNTYMRNLKWNMTLEEVKSSESNIISSEELIDEGYKSEKTEITYKNLEFPTFLGDLECETDMVLGVYNSKGLNEITYRIEGEKGLDAYEMFYTFLLENNYEDLDKEAIDIENVKLRSGYSSKEKVHATISCNINSDGKALSRITFVPETFSLKGSEQTTKTSVERVYEELPDADIRNLKWGMTLDDVKLYELEKISKEEFFEAGNDDWGNYHESYTMLTYDNVTLENIPNKKMQMLLCVYEDDGLTNVSYYTEGEDCSAIHEILFNKSQEKYGGFNTDSSFCYFDSDDSISSCWWDWNDTDGSKISLTYSKKSEYSGLPAYLYYYFFAPEKENKSETNTPSKKQTTESTNSYDSATMGEKNALAQAQNYIDIMPFSYNGLVEQLEYEGYSHTEAAYGADNCGADWNEQAEKQAAKYLALMPFSRQELIEQLEYEGYTHFQAVHGAEANGY